MKPHPIVQTGCQTRIERELMQLSQIQRATLASAPMETPQGIFVPLALIKYQQVAGFIRRGIIEECDSAVYKLTPYGIELWAYLKSLDNLPDKGGKVAGDHLGFRHRLAAALSQVERITSRLNRATSQLEMLLMENEDHIANLLENEPVVIPVRRVLAQSCNSRALARA